MSNCAVCGLSAGDEDYRSASNNIRAKRYLHEACRRELVAERTRRDAFSCQFCKQEFTPDTFAFAYQYDSGAQGLGSGFWKLEDQSCPNCHATISKTEFELCGFCFGGASRRTAIRSREFDRLPYRHGACTDASLKSMARRIANKKSA